MKRGTRRNGDPPRRAGVEAGTQRVKEAEEVEEVGEGLREDEEVRNGGSRENPMHEACGPRGELQNIPGWSASFAPQVRPRALRERVPEIRLRTLMDRRAPAVPGCPTA
jgi:hypothetical protein